MENLRTCVTLVDVSCKILFELETYAGTPLKSTFKWSGVRLDMAAMQPRLGLFV
jgi:hypothetical protein